MKKKLLSMLLTLCMVLALLPTAALAADDTAATKVYVGGTDVTAGGYWTSDGAGGIKSDGASASNYTVAYNKDTNVLTLNGAKITKTYTVTNTGNDDQCGIYANGSLTIELKGENTVDISATSATGNSAAVYADSSAGGTTDRYDSALVITGDSSASGTFIGGPTARGTNYQFSGSSYGLKAHTGMTVDGGVTVTAKAGKSYVQSSVGIGLDAPQSELGGCVLQINDGSTVIASGSLDNAPGNQTQNYGIYAWLHLVDGTVTATSGPVLESDYSKSMAISQTFYYNSISGSNYKDHVAVGDTASAGTNAQPYQEAQLAAYKYIHIQPAPKKGADIVGYPSATPKAVTAYSITLEPVSVSSNNPGEQTVEYALSDYTNDLTGPSAGWQVSPYFAGLTPGTQYRAWARTAAKGEYAAGTARHSGGTSMEANVGLITTLDASTFVPVTGISVPVSKLSPSGFTDLGSAKVEPESATVQEIDWGIKDAGTTEAYITREASSILHTPKAGTVTLTATVTSGGAGAADFTQEITINVVNQVWAGGEDISAGGYWKNSDGGITAEGASQDDYNVAYDKDTATLTLKDANLTKFTYDSKKGYAAAVYADDALNVVLVGDNTLDATYTRKDSGASFDSYMIYYALSAKKNLTISGDGSLKANANNGNGLSGGSPDWGASTITSQNGKVTISGNPTITASAIGGYSTSNNHATAIHGYKGIVIQGGTITAEKKGGKYAAIQADFGTAITVSGGTVIAKVNPGTDAGGAAMSGTAKFGDQNYQVMAGEDESSAVVVNEPTEDTYASKYVKLTPAGNPTFIPVTGITGVPTTATVGTDLTLIGTVAPANATNQTIAWSVTAAGTTGAAVNGSTLSTTAAGTVTVTATITNGLTASSNYTQDFTITVSAAEPSPVYGISLTPSGDHTFAEAAVGYGEQTALTVTVANTGNQATGKLTVALSGTDSDSFTLSKADIESIAANGSNSSFTVAPNTGLEAGAYTATVTVSGENGISQSFNVSFTVRAQEPAGTAPSITTASLPEGTVGEAYSQTLAAEGDEPISWSISDGVLPAGLTLSGNVISGTPTAAGTSAFAVKAENATGSDTQELSITIAAPDPTVSSVTVSPATVTVKKGDTQQFTASVKGTNDPAQTVTWTLEGDHHNATTISGGLLTLSAEETAQTLTVKAASTVDESKSGTATVTVTDEEVVRHTLTVTGGDGSGDYPEGSEVTVTAAVQDGKRFKEWTAEGVALDNAAANPITITMPAGNVTLTAVYDALYSVTVTTDGNGSGVASPAEAAEGDTVTISATANSGYQFKEWQVISGDASLADTGAASTSFAMPGQAVEVKAVFEAQSEPPEPNIYTITFNANGGSVTPASAKTGENGRLSSLPAPSRSGSYRFDGWFTASSGGAEVTTATVFTGDATIYAHWTYTGGGSSGGGGGGSSSSTTTKTEKNPDGSTTTTVTDKKTGTVTETTKAPDGTKEVVETKKDGTVTATVTTPDGTKAQVVAKPDGSMTSTEERKDGTKVTSETTAQGKTTAAVAVPKGAEKVTVLIPTPETPKTGEVAVIVKPDGSREVVKTSVATEDGLQLTLAEGARLELVDNSKSFADVPTGNWAADPVTFVSSRELFVGTAQDQFSPELDMSRAMIVTVLARLDGADTSGGAVWYEKSMNWAVEQGLSDGSKPDAAITREELATMLYRYAGSPDVTGTDLGEFTDAADASGYAADALRWAVAQGILQGSDGKLMPQNTATRAQVAAMFQRYIESTAR